MDFEIILEKLENELAAGNWEQVRKIVHQLKPNFMMLGMEEQRAKAADTETKIKVGNIDSEEIVESVDWLVASAEKSFAVLAKRLESV